MLGKTFHAQTLAAVAGVPLEQVQPLLDALVRKELLTVQLDPRSPERGQYGFLQSLVQKVAHDTLSKKDREAKHLAIAEHIESSWAGDEDEIVEVVAAHRLAAYELAPDAEDAAEIRAQAAAALAKAGRRAQALAATKRARGYYEQAADLTDDDGRRPSCWSRPARWRTRAVSRPRPSSCGTRRNGCSSRREPRTTPPACRARAARHSGLTTASGSARADGGGVRRPRGRRAGPGSRLARGADRSVPLLPRRPRRELRDDRTRAADRRGSLAARRPVRRAEHEEPRPQHVGARRGVDRAAPPEPRAGPGARHPPSGRSAPRRICPTRWTGGTGLDEAAAYMQIGIDTCRRLGFLARSGSSGSTRPATRFGRVGGTISMEAVERSPIRRRSRPSRRCAMRSRSPRRSRIERGEPEEAARLDRAMGHVRRNRRDRATGSSGCTSSRECDPGTGARGRDRTAPAARSAFEAYHDEGMSHGWVKWALAAASRRRSPRATWRSAEGVARRGPCDAAGTAGAEDAGRRPALSARSHAVARAQTSGVEANLKAAIGLYREIGLPFETARARARARRVPRPGSDRADDADRPAR